MEGNTMKGQREYVDESKFSGHGHILSDLLHKFSRWYELHRADVEHEAVRPFWDDPMHK
jgi:hypothetical protein